MTVTRQIRRAEIRNLIKGRKFDTHNDKALKYFATWLKTDDVPKDAPVEFHSCTRYYDKVMGFDAK